MTKKFLRVVGDVHGNIDTIHSRKVLNYRQIIENAPYSVQLGDMGFNYSGLDGVDYKRHAMIMGNHDNYDNPPINSLGDYGMAYMGHQCEELWGPVVEAPWQFYFVRGEWSIDIHMRQDAMLKGAPKCWWHEEELTARQMEMCLNEYKTWKPEVVMSHGCPAFISELVGSPGVWHFFGHREPRISNTQYLLQYMWDAHKPDLWLFGHYHRNWIYEEEGTTFMCIDELDFVDFNENWEVVEWTN